MKCPYVRVPIKGKKKNGESYTKLVLLKKSKEGEIPCGGEVEVNVSLDEYYDSWYDDSRPPPKSTHLKIEYWCNKCKNRVDTGLPTDQYSLETYLKDDLNCL